MKTRKLAMLTLVVIALVMASMPGPQPGAQSAKYKIRFGNSQGAGEATADTMVEFKKEVEAKSNGQIHVELYPSGQLGKIEEVMEMLRSGAAHIHINSPQYL